MSNTVRFSATMDDGVSAKLRGISAAFDKIGGPGSGASLFGNIGAKAVAKGFSLIDTAASGVVNVLGDALSAAMEEEDSVQKLDTALRANVKGWDGNRDAIERVLTARESLGFADDEQRQSLSLLLAATNDVSKSLDIQRTAMDLARLKHISLEEATNALIKVDDGHYRVLQSLGIKLDDNATSTDALRAVQAAAAGQAEDYANTTRGKLLVAQTLIGEKMESLGGVIMPVVADALTGISNAIRFFSGDPTVQGSMALQILRSAFRSVGEAIGIVSGAISRLIGFLHDVVQGARDAFAALQKVIAQDPRYAGQSPGYHYSHYPGSAEGGWVGMNGPELRWVGERGPEYVVPNHELNGPAGMVPAVIPIMLDGREITRVVDERLYYAIQKSPVQRRPI